MSDREDVLYRWLGIPPEEQPPNHYRLLGATLFEPSDEVIRHLAYQRKTALRLIEKGSERAQVKKLLWQVEKAAECLLDTETKAEYDRFLRLQVGMSITDSEQQVAANLDPMAQDLSSGGQAPTVSITEPRLRASKLRRRKRYSGVRAVALIVQLAGGGVLGSALAIFILWHAAGSDPLGLFAEEEPNPPNQRPARNSIAPEKRLALPSTDAVAASPPHSGQQQHESVHAVVSGAYRDNKADKRAGNVSVPNGVSVPIGRQVARLLPGLLGRLFDPHPSQRGRDLYVHPSQLGEPVGDPFVRESVSPGWSFDGSKNAILTGYLKIDTPGTHVFHTYNYYNALFVDRKLVCPFRGSVSGGTDPTGRPKESNERIALGKGLVRIASVGFVGSRGTVTVMWAKEGDEQFSPIPPELLFHDPDADPKSFLDEQPQGAPPKIAEGRRPAPESPQPARRNFAKTAFRIVLPSDAVVDSKMFATDAAAASALQKKGVPLATVQYSGGAHFASARHDSGSLDGPAIAVYEDGQLMLFGSYEKGKRQGNLSNWSTRGQRQFHAQYDKGTLHGVTCFFANDTLALVLEYSRDRLDAIHVIKEDALVHSYTDREDIPKHDAKTLEHLERFEKVEQESVLQEAELRKLVKKFDRAERRGRVGDRSARITELLRANVARRAAQNQDVIDSLKRRASGY